ncbi:MAG: CHAT domain-containing protein [Candidatus Krumholzibacteria bacterium]|nr:CHAT domain-containing protein [Candidatus Krumholzibacteria bacterium]
MSRLRLALALVLLLCGSAAGRAAGDPVAAFIAAADSISTHEGADALAGFVGANGVIVGAAVAQLLDVAFDVAAQGAGDAAGENVAFARAVAEIHAARSGSRVPLELVETYEAWTPQARLARSRAQTLEAEARTARNAGELDRAVSLYEEARGIYEIIDDRHALAVIHGSLGVVHWSMGDMDAVVSDYERALEARRAVEDRILEGRTLNGLGSAHQRTGDYATSAAYYQRAIDLRRRTGDLAGLGTSLTYLGNTYYLAGRLTAARDAYEEALPILEAQGAPEQMVEILIGVANLYSDMGRIDRATETYRRAVVLAETNALDEKVVICRLNVADNHRRGSLYAECFAEYDRAQPLVEQLGDARWRAHFLRDRGRARIEAGDLDGAREDLIAAAAVAKEVDDPSYAITTQVNIAWLYWELGAYDRCLRAAEDAKGAAEEAGQARAYSAALKMMALAQANLGRRDEALVSLEEAVAQDEYDGLELLALYGKLNIANQITCLGRVEEARRHYYAIAPEIASQRKVELVADLHLGIADTFEQESPDSAVYHYERALALIESARASLGAAEVETGFLHGERRFVYEEVARYFASLSRAGDDEWSARAFHTAERAKARALLDRLAAASTMESTSEEDALLDALYALDPADPGRAGESARLRGEIERLRSERRARALGVLGGDAGVATLEGLRGALPKRTAALAYALGDTASLLWVVDRDGVSLHRLPPRGELVTPVGRLRDALRQPGAGDAALRQSARALYETLVAPADSRVARAERLLIVPDGFLFEVPFEVLLAEEPGQANDWSELAYLGRRWATVYAPSASVYLSLRANRRSRFDIDLLAFGAPDFTTLAGDGAALAPLPHAREEVEAISEHVKDARKDVRLGAKATESAYKERAASARPRVIHLATHGLVDASDPSASSVVLARAEGSDEDGYLHVGEIAASRATAAVVVMSACESATGRVTRGEGVLGLSRAFLASGAGAVVASLWAVSDESTAALMRTAYERMLGQKKPAAEALQFARAELMDDPRYQHPFYWSPFIVIGTERSPW